MPKNAGRRPGTDLRPAIAEFQKAGLVDSKAAFARRVAEAMQNRPGVKPLEADYLERMFRGEYPMQNEVWRAIEQAFGLAARGISGEALLDAGTLKESLCADHASGLLRLLRSWPRPEGRSVSFTYVGLEHRRTEGPNSDILRVQGNDWHFFDLTCSGFRKPHLILLEFGLAENQWWSLQEFKYALVDDNPINAIKRLRSKNINAADKYNTNILKTHIGRSPTIYEYFALISDGQFPEKIYDFVPYCDDGKLPIRVKEDSLSHWLEKAKLREDFAMHIASLAYRAI